MTPVAVTAAWADLEIDSAGAHVFPGPIDGDTHMDKMLIGLGWHRNEVGPTLIDLLPENDIAVIRHGPGGHRLIPNITKLRAAGVRR